MRHLVRNGFILLALTALALWAIIPPSEKIRLGKDLRGGVSLVYHVGIGPDDPSDTLGKVITAVRERLDPNGILEIAITPQGSDRIEITMPLPSDSIKALRDEYKQELSSLERVSVNESALAQVMALPGEERQARLREIAGLAPGEEPTDAEKARLERLSEMADLYDAARAASAEYAEAEHDLTSIRNQIATLEASGLPSDDPMLSSLKENVLPEAQKRASDAAVAAAPADLAYDKAKQAFLAESISPGRVERALSLSDEPLVFSVGGGRVETVASPRQQALTELRESHPQMAGTLDEVVAAWQRYKSQAKTFDDPADIKRLLRSAGVLSFRITVDQGSFPDAEVAAARDELQRLGPRNTSVDDVRWYKINKLNGWVDDYERFQAMQANPQGYFAGMGYIVEEYQGEYYMLCWDRRGLRLTQADGEWAVASAYQSADQQGRPAIAFTMDTLGAPKLGSLTENNVGKKMAVLLDDEVYTAPTLQSRISSQGQITGQFDPDELQYIIKVLNAGALKQKLSRDPISENQIAPTLGADNLQMGEFAGVVAFCVIAAFMIVYYFGFGFVAVVALAFNTLFLLAAMALNHYAFTLPGIAGVILTFGQAVDANVLVYERMREEFNRGADLKTALRLGYSKALSAIVDGNVTTLIVCVVLGYVGTPEIRGFAITLGIGIATTLFAQLYLTRWIYSVMTDVFGWRKGSMLARAIPAIDRALTPRIDWMRLRFVSYTITLVLTLLGVVMVVTQGKNLLSHEFMGGTAVTLVFKEDPATGKEMTMERPAVEKRIKDYAETLGPDDPLRKLATADVLAENPEAGGISASRFRVKTLVQDAELLQSRLAELFKDELEVTPPLGFEHQAARSLSEAPVYPVLSSSLGDSIERPEVRIGVQEFYGGVAVVLDDLSTPVSVRDLEGRIERRRAQPDYSSTGLRQVRVVVLDGTEDAVRSAAVLVKDPNLSFFDDEARWKVEVAQTEWNVVQSALTEPATLASVESFGSAIAETFRSTAIIALLMSSLGVTIYLWVRFGSALYSIAALATTLHDCLVAVGLVALASVIYDKAPEAAGFLKLQPFKFDLNLVTAVMTILGYSLNDTIIVLDRIRENRGKLPYASRQVINDSINETISRTVITSGTTLLAVIALYILGGESLRVFSFTLLIGIGIGTYSSIAVASPLVWVKSADKRATKPLPGSEPAPTAA